LFIEISAANIEINNLNYQISRLLIKLVLSNDKRNQSVAAFSQQTIYHCLDLSDGYLYNLMADGKSVFLIIFVL